MHNLTDTITPRWQYLSFAVTAAILIYSHTPVGAALSMDSLIYLSTAGNILDGNGIAYDTYALNGPNVQPTTLWPPLYPVVLSGVVGIARLLGVSDVVAIAFFNFLAMLVSLYLILRIASLAGWTWAAFVVAIAFAISPSLQLIHMYAWSEVLFIPLSLAAYLGLQQHLARDDADQKKALYSMVFLLALATYTRYVGIAFFGAAALALVIYERGGLVVRLRTTTLASLAYVAIITPMLIRNYLVSDALSGGDRGTLDTSLVTDLGLLLWYLYLEFVNLSNMVGAAVLIFGVLSAVWLLFGKSKREVRPKPTELVKIALPFMFAASYLALLLISRMTQVTDLDSRMLSVAVPFLLLGLLGVYQILAKRVSEGLATIPFVLLLCAFAYNAANTHSSILAGWRDQGEPGEVLGLIYPSMTGARLDTLRSIGEHFAPDVGDLVLTDISRPVIASFNFPESDVRVVPGEPNDENLDAVVAVLQRKGLAIISGPDWGQALTNRLEGRADFYRIESATGRLEYIVITLPVRAQ